MNQFHLWPYDEVSVRQDRETALVETPWLTANVKVTLDNASAVEMLSVKLTDGGLVPDDLVLVNDFFKHLDDYPFCYVLPTRKEALDVHEVKRADRSLASVGSLLDDGLNVGRSEWMWDWDAARAFAGVGGMIHPESLFTVARRFHLLDLLEICDSGKIFEQIAAMPVDDFARAAALMVRQNHFVTQQCREALLPALETARSARPLVERFIRDETGHDKILQRALRSFDEDPESIPVARETRALMDQLRLVAETNFLAFAMAIDFFERSSYQTTDPLAALLEKGGFVEAARQINRHMAINDAGGHENVARGFLKDMAPCDPAYALEAFRMAEAISLLVMSIPRAAYALRSQP